MESTKIMQSPVSQISRILTLAIVGVATLLMIGLAYTANAATLTRQLEQGMSGSDVSDLQTFLAQDSTVYPQGLVTGFFGPLTFSAVSNFQVKNGIASVGRVGPITLALINQQMGNGMSFGMSPTISGISINASNSGATLNWNTNTNSSAVVYYSTSPIPMQEGSATSPVTIGGTSFLVNSNLQTTHTAVLTGLQSNTTYYYVVYVRDGSGNESVTWPSTFQTTY
jgi:peptidoglycan hydrolase-like protein with peptidoglycan-binding domain